MNNLANTSPARFPIDAMSDEAIANVERMEEMMLAQPQVEMETQHDLHGGMYARSIMIPKGIMITGALVKIPTMLICVGDAVVYIGSDVIRVTGYAVIPASAGRKQWFLAKSDVYLTMIFPTQAKTVADAEKEFTDQWAELLSNYNENHTIITGE